MCWNIFETTMCGMPALRSLQGKQLRSTCNVCINTFVHCGGLTFDKVADLFVTNFDMKYSTRNLFGTLDCCTFYALLINSNNFTNSPPKHSHAHFAVLQYCLKLNTH